MKSAGRWATSLLAVLTCVYVAHAEPSPGLDPEIETHLDGVRLTLVAEHPDVMTPTGIDVDASGNLWFVCSHTHFRPESYEGPEHDEVIRWREGKREVFYQKTDTTMDLELSPDFQSDGWVYLAQRDRILRVRDTDGDGVGDTEESIAVLKTEGTYPHNGLSGMAWHPSGDLIFALGENFWKQWTLSSRDGSSVSGTGEGGIFRCKPDGSELRRIAKGFWNPFGICVRSDGTMFAAENDPGSRPPCRMLHVVEGGEYGYQRLYGKATHHPFVCIDGELPGTLPMLYSLGEAPCGIVPMGNGVLVTSWTDHRIDFYPLQAKGASFSTQRVTVVSGSLDFRPTCIVQQNESTYYLTDWVVGSYQLHGKGRVWKLDLSDVSDPRLKPGKPDPPNEATLLAGKLRAGGENLSTDQILEASRSEDPFLVRAAIDALSGRVDEFKQAGIQSMNSADQVTMLLAHRKAKPKDAGWATFFLNQKHVKVRCESLRWIADEQLKDLTGNVEAVFSEDGLDYRTFECALAAKNTIDGDPRLGVVNEDVLIKQILNKDANPVTRAYALRLIDPNSKKLAKNLNELCGYLFTNLGENPKLLRELVHTLALSDSSEVADSFELFASPQFAGDEIAADAIAGMPDLKIIRRALRELGATEVRQHAQVVEEILRRVRGIEFDESETSLLTNLRELMPSSTDLIDAVLNPNSITEGRPDHADVDAWEARLDAVKQPVNIEAGRRIFFHRTVGSCYKCHRHQGRGNVVGPDLSAPRTDRRGLLRAILQPARDVDPQYFARTLIFEDGTSFTGIMLRDGGGGKEFYRDHAGKEKSFRTEDIVGRKELSTSLMPEGIVDNLTDREIRDLMAFLETGARE